MRYVRATVSGIVFSMAVAAPAVAQVTLRAVSGGDMKVQGQGQVEAKAQASATTQAGAAKAPEAAASLVNAAIKTAKAEHKTVLVYFGASWCGNCHLFDKFIDSPEVGKIMHDAYVLVPLTVQEAADKKALENPGADSVMHAAGVDKGGIPAFFFLDGDGKQLATSFVMAPDNHNIGHPYAPEEIKAFDELLQKTAPKLTAADRTKISDYLTALANGGGH